jgi:poly-gamma-glutamate synthesis protein (capsule biosynthesis protein)
MRVVAIGDVMLDFRVPRITSFFLVPSYLTLGLGRPPLEPYVYSPEAVEYLRKKGTRADELLSQSHAPKTIPIPRPGALFDGLRPHLAGDVVFANLESALTRRGRPSAIDMNYRAAPKFAAVLRAAGFNVVSLANNHCLDYGEVALFDTIAALRAAGVRPVGAGKNEREARRGIVIARKTGKIGILAYNNAGPTTTFAGRDWSGCSPGNPFVLDEDIPRMRSRARTVIVSIHWGQEGVPEPNRMERELAHRAIDLGADCVLGHHSHVAGPVELYRGKPIIYSLGNGVFGHDHVYWAGGILWELDFSPSGKFLRGTMRPLTKGTSAAMPRVARPEEAHRVVARIAAASQKLGARIEAQDGAGVLQGSR